MELPGCRLLGKYLLAYECVASLVVQFMEIARIFGFLRSDHAVVSRIRIHNGRLTNAAFVVGTISPMVPSNVNDTQMKLPAQPRGVRCGKNLTIGGESYLYRRQYNPMVQFWKMHAMNLSEG